MQQFRYTNQIIYRNGQLQYTFQQMSKLPDLQKIAIHALQKMRCPSNNPVVLLNVSQNSSSGMPTTLCYVQGCPTCGIFVKQHRQNHSKLKIGQINSQKLVFAQKFICQIVNKQRILTHKEDDLLTKTLKCFEKMINRINIEKEKLRMIGQYNGLSFEQISLMQSILKRHNSNQITPDLLRKINRQLRLQVNYKYEEIFQTMQVKLFKGLQSQLENYFCKNGQVIVQGKPSKFEKQSQSGGLKDSLNINYSRQIHLKNHLQYFGRPPLSPRDHFDLEDDQRDWHDLHSQKQHMQQLFNSKLNKFQYEEQFNSYGEDYDFDYLNTSF